MKWENSGGGFFIAADALSNPGPGSTLKKTKDGPENFAMVKPGGVSFLIVPLNVCRKVRDPFASFS
jgi:hypothetical protein